ncbi:putative sodium/calcium exchanger 7 isoform X2 [Drosophila montana]
MDKNGWSKLLNCLHIIINPAITIVLGAALIFRDKSRLWYSNIPDASIYGLYSFVLTIPISVFTFFHSRTSAPPAYHCLYTIMNLTGSMFLTFQCAAEISMIMDVCGHILQVPSNFMGATIKSISNSIADLVVNTSLALLGYEKMAYAATIGSAFCALILTTTSVIAGKIAIGKSVTAQSMAGNYGENAYILMVMGILSTLLWTAVLNYNARRSVGLFSMAIYLLYLVFAVLIRAGYIHQFTYDDYLVDAYEN